MAFLKNITSLNIRSFKTNSLFLLIILIQSIFNYNYAQCTHTGGINTPANGSPTPISSINGSSFNNGQYLQVNGMVAGKTYIIHTTCASYVTIGTTATPNLVSGNCNLNYQVTLPAGSGITPATTVYLNFNSNASCGTVGGPCQVSISCLDCDNAGGCGNVTPIVTSGTYSGTTADNAAPNGTAGGLWPESYLCSNIDVENPEFYSFVASSNSITFTICGGCSFSGVQLQIFEITSGVCGSGTINPIYGLVQVCDGSSTATQCVGASSSGTLSTTDNGSMHCGTKTVGGFTIGKTYYIMIDGYDAGSVASCPFTLDFGSGNSVLAVELVNFNGKPSSRGNELFWTTQSEINSDYFEVQASDDGQNFITIDKQKAAGKSTRIINYNMIDFQPIANLTYYRLKQVDVDGKFTFSESIGIKRDANNEIYLTPNPVSEKLNLYFDAFRSSEYTFTICDLTGKSFEFIEKIEKGYNNIQIDVEDLISNGMYILTIKNIEGEIIGIKKFIKN